mgnify:CR=1 FL=1
MLLLTTFSFGYENHCGISNLSYENNEFINDTHESKDRSSALDFCLIIFELIETARVNGIVKNEIINILRARIQQEKEIAAGKYVEVKWPVKQIKKD